MHTTTDTAVPAALSLEATRRVAPPTSRYVRVVKPLVDRMAALALIVALLPLLAGVAVVLLATLGSPILLRQRRVGLHGRVFDMYKFRTMLPDRRGERRTIAHPDRRRQHKSADDPRHTRVGRVLRRYGLDELPQLFNVLFGQMSVVGPRPELEEVVAGYAAWQHQRHLLRPGITGLWQVTRRAEGDGTMHLDTEVDLEYIQRLSPRTDAWIVLRTIPATVSRSSRRVA